MGGFEWRVSFGERSVDIWCRLEGSEGFVGDRA